MKADIKLLEELVVEAAERLRTLRRERDELQEQLESLQRQLEAAESGREPTADGEPAWEARRVQAAAIVQDALAELRSEETAA